MRHLCRLWLLTAAAVTASGCSKRDQPGPALAQADSIETTSVGGSIASGATESSQPSARQGVFKAVHAGGPGCPKPSDETMKLYDKYGAWHFCFSYAFRREATIFTEITNAVYDVITVGVPALKFVDLYQPSQDALRFQVTDQGNYRLYTYWTRGIGNVPPPGKYTDHKFINVKERSIDYWWKLRQRGFGKNARISGVAEAVFVPDDLCTKARQEGFLEKVGSESPCPQ